MTNFSVRTKLSKRVLIPVFFCCLSLFGIVWWYYPAISPSVDFSSHPAWSPDGKLIAFECTFSTKADIDSDRSFRSFDSSGPSEQSRQDICLSNVDGSNFQQITDSRFMYYPSWSPSGNLLAWMNDYDNVIVWDYRTAQSKQYHSSYRWLFGSFFENWDYLAWSVDENTIFLQGSGVTINLQTGEFAYLPEPADMVAVCCHTWSSDGNYLATIEHHLEKSKDAKLRVYQQQKLIFESARAAVLGRLSWSQDNTTLAWVGRPLNWTSNHIFDGYSLFLTYVPTGETVSVPGQFDVDRVKWSPTWWGINDKKLAFASGDKIYWLDIKRSYSPFSITVEKEGSINTKDIFFAAPVTWSLDGQSVAYMTTDRIIKIADIQGNLTTLITTDQ